MELKCSFEHIATTDKNPVIQNSTKYISTILETSNHKRTHTTPHIRTTNTHTSHYTHTTPHHTTHTHTHHIHTHHTHTHTHHTHTHTPHTHMIIERKRKSSL